MIDGILTIVGGFLTIYAVFFFRVANQKYRKIENISFWFATEKN